MNEEENTQEIIAPEGEAPPQGEQPSYSDVEQQAMQMGWKPDAEALGEDTTFVSAEEFVARQPLYDGLKRQGKELKMLRGQIDQLADMNRKTEERAYDRARKELMDQKKEAYASGDVDKVMEIDQELEDIKEQQSPPQVTVEEAQRVFNQWKVDNEWYDSDPEARAFADLIGQGMRAANPQQNMDDYFESVKAQVEARFPEKFGRQTSRLPNRGAAPTRNGAKMQSKSYSARLSDEQRRVGQGFVQLGTFKSLDEYAERLEAAGDLGS